MPIGWKTILMNKAKGSVQFSVSHQEAGDWGPLRLLVFSARVVGLFNGKPTAIASELQLKLITTTLRLMTWQNKTVSGICEARSLRSLTPTPRPVTLGVIWFEIVNSAC